MIWKIENKEQAKLLRKKCAPFDFTTHDRAMISELIKTMRTEMVAAQGIGLSANQIGFDISVFVAKADGKWYSVFNPVITKVSNETLDYEEGCLSVPETYGNVVRPERITLEGQDRNGKPVKIKAWGLLARIFQHEVDHLNGILFVDKAKNLHTTKPSTEQ